MKKSQKERIKDKLRDDGYVDNFWCIQTFSTTRLGAYVHTLKAEGWEFDDDKSGFLPNSKNWCYWLKSTPRIALPKFRYEHRGNVVIEIPIF